MERPSFDGDGHVVDERRAFHGQRVREADGAHAWQRDDRVEDLVL